MDDAERSALKRHFGGILAAAKIDVRDTGFSNPAPDPELIIETVTTGANGQP